MMQALAHGIQNFDRSRTIDRLELSCFDLESAGELAVFCAGEMREMQTKNPRADIMNVHAKAYTTDEIKLIADFFSKQ